MALFKQIVQSPLSEDQYYREEYPKAQIFLHHTAGNSDPFNVIRDWNTDSRGRIATCVVVGRGLNDGKIIQAFSSKYWAYHLGVKSSVFNSYGLPPKVLDKTSIGIEICNWGQLTESGGRFFNYVNREVPPSEVCELSTPFKNFRYFERYTPAQLNSVRELLLYFGKTYNIPLQYNSDIWQVTNRALTIQPGVFTHNSVRADKIDVFPQPELIQMLKSL